MAGRRLVDVVALLNASRAVARKHLSLRQSQLEVYAKTSSITKALRSQIDQATRDPRPAAHRFSQTASLAESSRRTAEQQIPSSESVGKSRRSRDKEVGFEQDHHYSVSDQHSVTDSVPGHDLNTQQEQAKTNPLADGTIPPKDSPVGQADLFGDGSSRESGRESQTSSPEADVSQRNEDLESNSSATSSMPNSAAVEHGHSAEESMILQRQSEFQIPSRSAEPPIAQAFRQDEPVDEGTDFGIEQEQDVFYQPPETTAPVLSALPRIKLPKTAEDEQGGDPHVPQKINADVFYSSKKFSQKTLDRQAEATVNTPPPELIKQLFHSPEAARLLNVKSKKIPGGLKAQGARTFVTTPLRFTGRANSTSTGSNLHSRGKATEESIKPDRESLRSLADDIAKDAQERQSLSAEAKPLDPKVPVEMRESRVPSSQLGRLWQFGGLAASMAFGAVGDRFTRTSGMPGDQGNPSFMLSAGNMDRLVAKLSKMRGAALKLGQMMSFQDSKTLPNPIQEVLQRVQDSADYMPASQRNAVLAADLGSDWALLFDSFDERPMAAASIGQVHGAVLKSSGQRVAVKVQYPGVATSISSDLNNLSLLLTASRLLPKGLYLEKTIANARTELAWECDYVREANCAKRFKDLLADENDVFAVPDIIGEASGKQVLTMERMEGLAVTKIQTFTQEQKDWIGTQILRLCLREIIDFNYMQTDPNWTNFLYNAKTSKLELLDFGASREYSRRFIDLYIQVLAAASRKDREACRDLSIELGYLTGYESKAMLNAHIDSVLTLAEPFLETAPDVYDFTNQTITDRVRGLIPVMVRERLAPPPEETYSLHRKLSGAFLLCARLGSKVKCREMFSKALASVRLAEK